MVNLMTVVDRSVATAAVAEDAVEFPGPAERAGGALQAGDPLFTARFAPPKLPRFLVRRGRLLDRITAGNGQPLTLVVGPAGAGKTVLVSQWTAEHAGREHVAWVTVEPGDTEGSFWSYVLEALRRSGAALPEDLVSSPSARADHAVLARLAAALSDLSAPVTLVLDQFDALAARREIGNQLHFVLRHAAPRLRAVLTCRFDPRMPLHRYRAAGEMAEIRNSDLAFDTDAASALLACHRLAPGPADVRALVERTEGWAAGLRLCALAMQRSEDPSSFVEEFTTDRTSIADYLLTEVVEAQPEAARDLLLRVSVLPRVSPALADALTGRDDAEWILDGLERANAFVESLGATG